MRDSRLVFAHGEHKLVDPDLFRGSPGSEPRSM